MGAARGLITPLGEQLVDLLDSVAKCRERVWEAQSTKEVFRKIREVNEVLERDSVTEVMIVMLNVEAVYQSEGRPQVGVRRGKEI